jgi:hypothetical protein
MVSGKELAAHGLRSCRGCGQVKPILPASVYEEVRAFGGDATALDRCLACEQYAAVGGARKSSSTFDLDQFRKMLGLAGRNVGPGLLLDAWTSHVILPTTVTAVISDVWSGAEYPQDSLTRVDWLDLFEVAGFTVDGRPAERPTEPVKLWRGCVPPLRRRMSWTSDRELAEKYATGMLRGRPKGVVHETIAPPDSLLCVNHSSREESEYVINARGLKICDSPDQ